MPRSPDVRPAWNKRSYHRDWGARVSTEATELYRIISAAVRGMLDSYRIQAQAGPNGTPRN